MQIEYVPYGIANKYAHKIELNENLKQFPKLHDAILQHEFKHTDAKGFNRKDFMLDFGEDKINNVELLKFMFKYPKSFFQFLPFYKRKDIIFYDINLIILWTILLGIISGSVLLVVL